MSKIYLLNLISKSEMNDYYKEVIKVFSSRKNCISYIIKLYQSSFNKYNIFPNENLELEKLNEDSEIKLYTDMNTEYQYFISYTIKILDET
jgi:hypothetical protein